MSSKKTNLSLREIADLTKSFDDDEDIVLFVQPPKDAPKNPFDTFLNRKKTIKTQQEQLNNFRATINGRIKSKNDFVTPQQKPNHKVINVDSTLAPTLHTRSKGAFSTLNEFVFNDLDDGEKQFKDGRYQYAQRNKIKQKKPQNYLKQTKLTVVNVDDQKDTKKEPICKLDGPTYSWRKKAKPQPDRNFKGIEFAAIRNNGFIDFERDKEKRKLQREEHRKKQKENEEKQKIERVKHLENTFSNLLGLTKTVSHEVPNNKYESRKEQQSDEELKNLNILEEIQNQEQKMEGNYGHMDDERYRQQKRLKYGLDEIVKPYDSTHAFPFVKAILGYKFKSDLEESTKTKRIPDIFTDSEVYKRTFHYLVVNQCIADLHQRMKKKQKESSEKILVQIREITDTGHSMVDLRIKEVGSPNDGQDNEKKNFLLKNYSMSKNRIGIITNNEFFRLQNYGIHSQKSQKYGHSYTFLCMLKTPESKQQVKDPTVVVSACIDSKQLEFIIRLTSSHKAYFYDIEKLSTNIREYMSISNVEYSWLSDHIYNPKFIDSEKRQLIDKSTRDCVEKVFLELKSTFNMTQFESIRQMVLRERGIVLLQGPPGTGKTSTLLGLLAAQYAYLKKIGDKRKIMICAPSNAAIDHITKRLRTEGLVNGDGQKTYPNVLRLGIVQTQDKDITSCSLDHICESKIVAQKNQTLKESKMTTIQINEELMKIQKRVKSLNVDFIKAQRQKNNINLQKIILQLKEKNTEYIRLEGLSYSFRREKIISKKHYQELEKTLLKNAEILIVTLSSSGGQKMQQVRGDIACLIVDEAAQATEPSLLIALQTGVEKVMLIGDPSQLPATTLSTDSNKTLFNRSLFERFIDAGIQPYFLNIQYRMMPMIRAYPSEKFYRGKLVDGQSVTTRQVPQHLKGYAGQRSVIFIDIKGGQERVQESSFCNFKEVNFITKFLKRSKLLQSGISIGVITPYQAQRKLLLKQTQKLQKTSSIMINTIDSFQGQQKDLILISTVRSNDRKQIGFLMDERRINVSVTRAKYAMIIIGNGDTMGSNQIWDGYLKFIEAKKLYFEVNTAEDEDKILTNLNKKEFFNHQGIRRRFYEQSELTFDPRKVRANQIGQNDLRKKPRKTQEKIVKQQSIRHQDIIQENSSSNLNTPEQVFVDQEYQGPNGQNRSRLINSEFPLKKGPSVNEEMEYQAEELIRKKRKKEEQAKDYEQACQRLKLIEKEKASDDFYKFLFQ